MLTKKDAARLLRRFTAFNTRTTTVTITQVLRAVLPPSGGAAAPDPLPPLRRFLRAHLRERGLADDAAPVLLT